VPGVSAVLDAVFDRSDEDMADSAEVPFRLLGWEASRLWASSSSLSLLFDTLQQAVGKGLLR